MSNAQDKIQSQSHGQDKIRAILIERAKALAQSKETETGEMIQVVVFHFADEKYGIATEHVHEVQPLRDLTPVPCTPNFCRRHQYSRGALPSSTFAVSLV